MKRRDLIRHLEAQGCQLLREGANHSVYVNHQEDPGATPLDHPLHLGGLPLDARGVEGPPDLVVEILSPSNRSYDRNLKRKHYLENGIPELWIRALPSP